MLQTRSWMHGRLGLFFAISMPASTSSLSTITSAATYFVTYFSFLYHHSSISLVVFAVSWDLHSQTGLRTLRRLIKLHTRQCCRRCHNRTRRWTSRSLTIHLVTSRFLTTTTLVFTMMMMSRFVRLGAITIITVIIIIIFNYFKNSKIN